MRTHVYYTYQVLNAVALGGEFATIGPVNPGVGAWIMDLRHDRRDNPLYPRRGYKIFSTLELASPWLAGDVTYQRFDLSSSYHHRLFGGLGLNLGVSHGLLLPSNAQICARNRALESAVVDRTGIWISWIFPCGIGQV